MVARGTSNDYGSHRLDVLRRSTTLVDYYEKSIRHKERKAQGKCGVSDQETYELTIRETKSLRSSTDEECVPGEGSGRNTVLDQFTEIGPLSFSDQS